MDWFTSDWHLDHKNIIKYSKRPFSSVEEMNATILKNMQESLGEEDTLHFLGDFSFSSIDRQKYFLDKINVKKKIIYKGNHDRSKKQLLLIGFDEVYTTPRDITFKGVSFRLSHYPYAPKGDQGLTLKDKFLNRRPSRRGVDWLLCGHVHEKWKVLPNQINVGVDVWGFKPLSIDTVFSLINNPVLDSVDYKDIYNY